MEPNIQGPTSTADSKRSGRLVVDAKGVKSAKKKYLIARVKKMSSEPES